MIIARTLLRISFAGGGSDLQAYYQNGYGSVVSTAIDKLLKETYLPEPKKREKGM